jgi:hypothetical protein
MASGVSLSSVRADLRVQHHQVVEVLRGEVAQARVLLGGGSPLPNLAGGAICQREQATMRTESAVSS